MTHSLIVYGRPAPQGSKSFKGLNRRGKAILAEDCEGLKPWRQGIVTSIRTYIRQLTTNPSGPDREWKPLDSAQIVRMVFTLRKPTSAPKTRRTLPDKKPDLDKLARAVGDALTIGGMIKDDALLIEYSRLAKVFPGEDPESLEAPGVRITLDSWFDTPLHPSLMCPTCGGFAPNHKCQPTPLTAI